MRVMKRQEKLKEQEDRQAAKEKKKREKEDKMKTKGSMAWSYCIIWLVTLMKAKNLYGNYARLLLKLLNDYWIYSVIIIDANEINFTDEENAGFQRRYEEGYDLQCDERYNKWKELHYSTSNATGISISFVALNRSCTFTDSDTMTRGKEGSALGADSPKKSTCML